MAVISVTEAVTTILNEILVLGTERVAITAALGRVLAEDISAPFNIPPLDNSAMDGYAVRFQDLQGASAQHPARLKILGDIPAGYSASKPMSAGETYRIMTGAPVPAGADTVVMQEDTQAHDQVVEIFQECPRGSHIRRAGEDLSSGDSVVTGGTLLGPAHIGVLASIKKSQVTVYQRPRVAIISTGDELVDVDEELFAGKIVSSNSYSLQALVLDSGAIPMSLGIARDTREALREKFAAALHADMIISSGGVSVGDYDFVKDVMQDLGAEMKFWKVAMRPGNPLAFGVINGKPAFGLPGNPVSVMVSFEQFVRPSIRKMSGHQKLFRPVIEATAQENVETRQGRQYFIRCMVRKTAAGYVATTTGEQGSGMLMSMAKATGLMMVPADREGVKAGDKVTVQILDRDFGYSETLYY
ncbi:MAG: molybdopterin molybdotransferase MoeA [Proteobacteria bacterium]|nr:molybdopterin molybdotransferase MoeA [Pseudomonadota bacterium]